MEKTVRALREYPTLHSETVKDGAPGSGRNDDSWGWMEEKGTRVATLPSKMRGFFAALRMMT